MENKLDQFIWWLCGENVEFPYFKDMPVVPYPVGYVPPRGKLSGNSKEEVEGKSS